jgi:nitrate reductase NapAB chaperone NapD
MPIKSYLALPREGQEEELETAIEKIGGCEIIPSQNGQLLVVVTDTKDEAEDEMLYDILLSIQSLKHLTLVSGFKTL